MSIRNNHWYNLNEQRSYPADETASLQDDAGNRLPNSFLADMKLSWPLSLGRYAFISGASSTTGTVSIMISACTTLDNALNDEVLIAGVTIPRATLAPYTAYELKGYAAGVAGFVVFGNNTETFSTLCSSPEQSLLLAKAARAYIAPAVSNFQLAGSAQASSGLIDLVPRQPLVIRKTPQVINSKLQSNVLEFGLVENRATSGEESVFSAYAGACAARVSSRNCGDPQPLESINGVLPDCSGRITLNFQGCAVVARNTVDCGLVIECGINLDQSCKPPYLPDDSEGILPGEVPPVVIPPPPPDPPDSESMSSSISESASTAFALPYCDTFDLGLATNFTPIGAAMFEMVDDESPGELNCCSGALTTIGCDLSESLSGSFIPFDPAFSYGTSDLNARIFNHISLFTGDVQTLFRKYTTDVRILPDVPGTDDFVGIVINYRIGTNGLPTYFLAAINANTFTFSIQLFNGVDWIPLVSLVDYDIRNDDWMRISFSAKTGVSPFTVDLSATLVGVTRPSLNIALDTLITTAQWGTDSGQSGLFISRSLAHFSYWRIDAA